VSAPADDRAALAGDLAPRVVSSLILAAVAVACGWFGGWAWAAAAAIGMALAGDEWCRMAGADTRNRWVAVVALALCGVFFVKGEGLQPMIAALVAMVALGRAVAGAGAVAWAGTLYLALGGWCLAGLRFDDAAEGRVLLFALFAIVWATDTAAYVGGRTLGGPKLLPAISPNKTWAGFVTGLAAGALAGFGYALVLGHGEGRGLIWAGLGALLSLAAQGGDVLESIAKRHFGVKDSSGLIPGHGGLLDRLDGHFAAGIALMLAVLFSPSVRQALL
jgi:phosphatidate cytidylyltransferase